MLFIIGLGNPGVKYQNTRHNIGFTVIDALAEKFDLKWKPNKKFNADVANGKNLALIKPQTFMNDSGQAARAILAYYKILPKKLGLFLIKKADLSNQLIVIHDDLDLPLGAFKIQSNRSAAGHRGVQSIVNALKTQNFTRVRVGTANELLRVKIPPEKFVLEQFSREEKNKLQELIPKIIKDVLK
ncbi:aminoacyl-tRNA hydrolase [Candidatus Falkowbacteria bacterium CG10_big_fil_rev_8_21_14_0_10_43_11]|uniref:Peptidyl-tRNA hydrolase n=1 Tax=Candidatus Falkowbacteria bacterium CG10_big_fil_rev_8_21_14_0_10_43_11 TaxID=1974568 RepID=A0A2M6WMX9_9BACT|nr:MAG: aminoacyl-tRNA hydrolase [Candidatus Falkowbacteria bacterium CG10_big_fil_rev_8_21_14_0_10_43_11]